MEPEPTRHATDAEPDVGADPQTDDALDPEIDPEIDPRIVPQIENPSLDLDTIEADLADVEVALARLDAGTYWTDEVTGAPLPDELLVADPTARHARPI